jgi:transcription elongation factor GreA
MDRWGPKMALNSGGIPDCPAGGIGTQYCINETPARFQRAGSLFLVDSHQEIGTVSDRIPMTQEGYNKIQAEVEHLERVEMPLIAEKIAEARSEGDLKENAEYHAQREAQGLMQAKINQLRNKLSMAIIIDPTKVPKDEVAFGATVKVLDLDLDDVEEITLVGQGDEDYDKGRYLITSPLGQGLLGKKVGEEANIPVPKGTLKFKVLEIRYDS